jgi:hypothetical protein
MQWLRVKAPWWMYRIYLRYRLIRDSADQLNRRVEVENVLLAVASGKRATLTPEECKQLAYKLGVPSHAIRNR